MSAPTLDRQEPQIECPACGETVRQVSSATLSLALSQHYRWVCKQAMSVDVEALRALQRYAVYQFDPGDEMPDADGDWVKWADVAALLPPQEEPTA